MNKENVIKEISFSAVRSGGAGGQHANKVSSKVVLSFHLESSIALNDLEKIILHKKLSNKLSKEGILILTCDESRSQHQNKEIVVKRFLNILETGLKRTKTRIPTKISKGSKMKRLDQKKKLANKKTMRKKPNTD